MKKNFNFLLMAALVCGLSYGVTSCKSDEDVTTDDVTSQVTVDPDLLARGVEVDIKGGTVDIVIDGKGKWTAGIADADWVGINKDQVVYSGKQTLTLRFDRNLTGAGRRAQLIIFDENGTETYIPVYQNPLYDGQEAGNSSAQWFSQKGLGHGVDYNYFFDLNNQKNRADGKGATNLITSKITKNDQLFNFARIEKLQESKLLGDQAYYEAAIEIGDMKAVMADKIFSQDKQLHAQANIGIELGILNVEAEFQYGTHKREDRAKIDYDIIRHAPMYDVRIAPGEVAAYAFKYARDHSREITDEQMDELNDLEEKWKKANQRNPKIRKAELTSSQKRQIAEKWAALYELDFDDIFSMAFNRLYGELAYWEPVITDPEMDEEQKIEARRHCKDVMQKLDDYYGPFFLSQAEYGGSFNILCKVDTSYTEGADTISGSITASLSGIGELGGKITYTSKGSDLFRNSNCTYQVFGGKADDITSALFSLTHSAQMTDYDRWGTVLNGWIDGMRSKTDAKYGDLAEQSHAELLNFSITPVWFMMPDSEIANFARAWFINKYWNKGIKTYLNLVEGTEECDELQQLFDMYLRDSKTKPSLGEFEDAIKSMD